MIRFFKLYLFFNNQFKFQLYLLKKYSPSLFYCSMDQLFRSHIKLSCIDSYLVLRIWLFTANERIQKFWTGSTNLALKFSQKLYPYNFRIYLSIQRWVYWTQRTNYFNLQKEVSTFRALEELAFLTSTYDSIYRKGNGPRIIWNT